MYPTTEKIDVGRAGHGVQGLNVTNNQMAGEDRSEQPQRPGRPVGSMDRIARDVARERQSQCSAASLRDSCVSAVKNSIYAQDKAQSAARYLELADRNPEVAELIELARTLSYL